MKQATGILTKQSLHFVLRLFFAALKGTFLLTALTAGALIAGQSSVAPVSVRLLTSYGMEYAVSTLKPWRHLFPKPYPIEVETN